MLIQIILCALGFCLLYYGADWLVRGSSSLAGSLGITPIVIGLTVVAFGTSAPELVVSLVSSIKGRSMIALGNVIGSNICNIALILGLSAACRPISGNRSVIRRDIPIMLGVSAILLIFSIDDQLTRVEGALLFAGLVAYTFMNYRFARADGGTAIDVDVPDVEKIGYVASRPRQIILIVVGIAGVVSGAQLVVESAVLIMQALGVNEKFIGLTIVAFGTSLPELATSIVAAMRGEMDISIGNLVGSNVFNILSVLGATAIIRPIPIPGGFIQSGLVMDYAVMMLTSALPLWLMRKTDTVSRKGGAFLLVCYVGYVAYLVAKG